MDCFNGLLGGGGADPETEGGGGYRPRVEYRWRCWKDSHSCREDARSIVRETAALDVDCDDEYWHKSK